MRNRLAAIVLGLALAMSGCGVPTDGDPAVAAYRDLVGDTEQAASKAFGRLSWTGELHQGQPLRIDGTCYTPVGERESSEVTFADDADDLLAEVNKVLARHGYSQAERYGTRNGYATITGIGAEGVTLRVRVKSTVRIDVLIPSSVETCS